MNQSLRVLVDGGSPSRVIEEIARSSAPMIVITHRMLAELETEFRSEKAAHRFIRRLASKVGKPIGVNGPSGDGTSMTVFIAPRGWTNERLQGWVAGLHESLEDCFGDVTEIRRSA